MYKTSELTKEKEFGQRSMGLMFSTLPVFFVILFHQWWFYLQCDLMAVGLL